MKKKILILIVALTSLTLVLGSVYYKNRNKYIDEFETIVDSLNIDQFEDLYSETFLNKIRTIKDESHFHSNKLIKSTIDELVIDLKNGNYINKTSKQISYEEMIKQIDISTKYSNDYGVGRIYIYTDDNYGETLDKHEGYVGCSVFVYGLSDEVIEDTEADIKIRGNSTSSAPKKPYNIKFSFKADLCNFGSAKKWSLLAEYFDPTMMRNNLFLNFANTLGLDYTSNCQYVEVWVDGRYNGCYLLTESVETGKNRVNIDVDNGDFLIEYEAERDEDGVTYITTEHGFRFAMSDPEKLDENTYHVIKQKIDEFDDAIYSGDYSVIENLLDTESFAKFYLVNEYAKTVDFSYSSVNFYYKEGKFYAGPVWDFDLSSGNASPGNYVDYWNEGENDSSFDVNGISYEGIDNWNGSNLVFARLYEYDEFKELVAKIFNEYSGYMQSFYNDSGIIDSLLDNYGGLINNNYASKTNGGAGWDFGAVLNLQPFETYEENVAYLKYWLENRYNYLEKQLTQK